MLAWDRWGRGHGEVGVKSPISRRNGRPDPCFARGYRTAASFIAIAYLRLGRLKHLPAHPFAAPVTP